MSDHGGDRRTSDRRVGGTWRHEPHALYRFHDRDGRLLYVGITLDVSRRLREHRDLKGWWRDVARIDLDWHEDRDAALAAERRAVAEEAPAYNSTARDWAEYRRRGAARNTPAQQAARAAFPTRAPERKVDRAAVIAYCRGEVDE